MRKCPFCAEDIADDVTRCPYCASDLTAANPAAAVVASAASASDARQTPTIASPAAAVRFSHTGQRFLLGYDDTNFGIWDRASPAAPVERFPRSDQGWTDAWHRYSSLEPANQPVQAVAASPGGPAAYGGAPAVGQGAPPAGWSPYQQPYPYPAQSRSSNGMAVASLVLGLCGVVLFALLIPPILAIVFGNVARGQIRNSGGTQEGEGMAIAGIVLGIVEIVLFVVVIIVRANQGQS